jgi:drug/metabolite transporter (DMT)-like permease
VLELWVPITVFAAFFQNARSALQKAIKGELSNTGATYVRFAFGVPFALIYLMGLVVTLDQPLPTPGRMFFIYGGLGGVAQILGTAALLYAVSFRSFAVGTAYSKTEPVQAAIFGFLLLGESIGEAAGFALLISLAGVVVLGVAEFASGSRRAGGPRIGRALRDCGGLLSRCLAFPGNRRRCFLSRGLHLGLGDRFSDPADDCLPWAPGTR